MVGQIVSYVSVLNAAQLASDHSLSQLNKIISTHSDLKKERDLVRVDASSGL